MSERKTEEEKINEKGSFLQKILGFRFTPSISAWKLATALFLLMAIAYAVNGAGIIAKGDNLEVSGNATVQGKVGIGTTAPGFLLNVVSSGTALPVEISASFTGTGDSFGLLRLWRLNNAVNDEAGIIFSLSDNQPARQEYAYVAARISASKSTNESGDLLFSTTDAGVTRQERMRITSIGNVGINTTTPLGTFHVKNANTDFIVTAGGNVGIGTTTPNYLLQIASGTDGRSVNLSNVLYVNGSSGNVGIGTTSPTSKLHVIGKGTFTGGIDPPYISFSNESHESIRQYAEEVEEHEKVMQFWNGEVHRMEVYVINEDKFYTLIGNPLEEN